MNKLQNVCKSNRHHYQQRQHRSGTGIKLIHSKYYGTVTLMLGLCLMMMTMKLNKI